VQLGDADLSRTRLGGAQFFRVAMNWKSRELVAAALTQAAGDDAGCLAVAAKVLCEQETPWEEILSGDDPLSHRAIAKLATFAWEDEDAPAILRSPRGRDADPRS
jgi:hypothetical protein